MQFTSPTENYYIVGSHVEVNCTNPNRYFLGIPYWTGPDGRRMSEGGVLVLLAQEGDVGTYTCHVDKLPDLPQAPPSRSFQLVLAGESSPTRTAQVFLSEISSLFVPSFNSRNLNADIF